ncbi:citrate/succinate antiporter [Escherichia coli]|nr:citrate/succinate antiporter [Escherichia coli]
MFVTGAAPNVLGPEFVSNMSGFEISCLQLFLCFHPVGVILLSILQLPCHFRVQLVVHLMVVVLPPV